MRTPLTPEQRRNAHDRATTARVMDRLTGLQRLQIAVIGGKHKGSHGRLVIPDQGDGWVRVSLNSGGGKKWLPVSYVKIEDGK